MAVTINGVSPTTAQQREFAAAMGLPVLLQTVTVGTAQQDIDFTGLDLDADKMYRIELVVATNAASDQSISLYYNNDTTAANYQSQFSSAESTVLGGARSANAFAAIGHAPNSTNFTPIASFTLYKTEGRYPSARSECVAFNGANLNLMKFIHRWANTANVTSIKLRHASNFGVGTVAKIYKV